MPEQCKGGKKRSKNHNLWCAKCQHTVKVTPQVLVVYKLRNIPYWHHGGTTTGQFSILFITAPAYHRIISAYVSLLYLWKTAPLIITDLGPQFCHLKIRDSVVSITAAKCTVCLESGQRCRHSFSVGIIFIISTCSSTFLIINKRDFVESFLGNFCSILFLKRENIISCTVLTHSGCGKTSRCSNRK